jgi:hypothetical protein
VDSKNIVERERESMVAVIKDKTGKAPLSISVISTSTAQILFKEEDLPSFQKLLDSKMIQLVETKKDNFHQRDIARLAHLYLSGYHKDLAHAAEPTRYHHSTNIVQGSNVGEAKILQYTYPEPLELHNKEGHSGFSTISGRDGITVNKIEVVHKVYQKCESCDKTLLKSSYTSHLKSVGHKKNCYLPIQIINSHNNQIPIIYNPNSNTLTPKFSQ